MVQIKMQNPGPAALMVINPKRRSKNTMPARKRATRRKARPVHHRASNPVRRTRKASTTRVRRHHSTASRRRNPLFAHKRRRSVRRNPVSGALGQAIPLVAASFAITLVSPMATRLVGGFLPLGQFTQPVVLAGTGYGLGWVAGKLGPTFSKYRGALEIMGVTLGLTALVAPYLRGLLAPSAPAQAQAQGMNGFRNRRGLNGIAAYPSIPAQLQAASPSAQAGMNGIAAYPVPGRF